MKIEILEISGFRAALEALRLPYSKECRSMTSFDIVMSQNRIGCTSLSVINEDDLNLMTTLIKRGDEHAKPLRGILVYVKITAPIHFFWDCETYLAGHQRLFSESTMHAEGRGLSGKALAEELHKIPFDREITKADYFSYQCLRNIYKQRRSHRKDEWQEFCDWIETLPYAKELILPCLGSESCTR